MGKNRDRESLIGLLVNTVVHKIVVRHTNKSESKHFLTSEIIEYGNQTKKTAQQHTWNNKDKEYIKSKSLKKIEEKLTSKYSDVRFSEKEASDSLDTGLKEIL